ncbi:hypothetical protein [Paenibacillus periandrae]|uniref:hypothetical protein n=1 Tax=Paenibacillus periandrae TaxID=1761741 RepID=UPI001F089877|nr:hypothetical protein [Paenibacillus periandrae]
MKFQYTLTHNESEERVDEGAADFHFPFSKEDIIEAVDFESMMEVIKDKFKHLTNNEWDWYCNAQGTNGEFRFQNYEDGLAVVFEVTSL